MIFLKRFSDLKEDEINLVATIHYNHWSKYSDYMNFDETKDKFKKIYTDNSSLPIGYALFDNDTIIGFCVLKKENLKKYPEIYPWISDVMILEKYRGKGYGRKMIDLIMSEVEKMGYKRIYLWTDKAPEFYKKIGFKYKMIVEKNHDEGYGELYYKDIE